MNVRKEEMDGRSGNEGMEMDNKTIKNGTEAVKKRGGRN